MRRLAAGAAGLALVAGGAAGGYLGARATEPGDETSISDDEHERLISLCDSDPDIRVACVAWVEETITRFDRIDGCGYPALLHYVSRNLMDPGATDRQDAAWYDEARDLCEDT